MLFCIVLCLLIICFIIAALPFTMKKLIVFKWTDKCGQPKTLRLKDEMTTHWRDAGELLDLSTADLKRISENHQDVRECLRDVLQDWIMIGSSDDYPATWGGLLRLLEDLKLISCAKCLQEALECTPVSSL